MSMQPEFADNFGVEGMRDYATVRGPGVKGALKKTSVLYNGPALPGRRSCTIQYTEVSNHSFSVSCQSYGVDGSHSFLLSSILQHSDEFQRFYTSCSVQRT